MKLFLSSILTFVTMLSFGQTVSIDTITLAPYLTINSGEYGLFLGYYSPESSVYRFENTYSNANSDTSGWGGESVADWGNENRYRFDFEWGYTYKLLVRQEKNTWSNGGEYMCNIDSVISKTKVPETTQFELRLSPSSGANETGNGFISTLKRVNDTTYLYFDQVEIEVPERFKSEFSRIIKDRASGYGTFVFVNKKRIRLVGIKL